MNDHDNNAAAQSVPKGGAVDREPSPTAGMNLGQRIAHVGGRENAAGYIEFGSPMAVQALIDHMLRDLPMAAEIERLKDLADSEGSRAVKYLNRARAAEAALAAQEASSAAEPVAEVDEIHQMGKVTT